MSWRDDARNHIKQIAESYLAAGGSRAGLEQEIRSKYPFGPKENYPYKVWCQEVIAYLHQRQPRPNELALLKAWNAGQPIDYSNHAPEEKPRL